MTQTKPANANLSIDEMPWPELLDPPPTDLRVLRGEEPQS